ncbi:hypothetical protein IFM89_010660 [Coptis chinensis]|uniref:RRM domain-containing protein n=1 Tax=Coptis chinensis TaxID=261450 RepID=A0A835LR14_9MAGN|nr:hypothetical protein IFM89_010660 [Coptis chinensis]
MTLNEYEKICETKYSQRKLPRKEQFDSKGFESMKLLKKGNHEIFVKLGSEKDDAKRKEDANSKADKVKKLFEQAQELSWIVRLCKSRGFGFIEYASHENAQSVIQTMYQQEHHSRKIRVNFATDWSGGLHNCSGDYGGGGGSSGGGVYGSRSNFDGSAIAGGYGGSGGEYGVTNGGGSDNFFSGSSTVSGGHSQNHPLDDELGTLLTSGRG